MSDLTAVGVRWREKVTGKVCVAIAVRPVERGPLQMVLPIKDSSLHIFDWMPEKSFRRAYERVPDPYLDRLFVEVA